MDAISKALGAATGLEVVEALNETTSEIRKTLKETISDDHEFIRENLKRAISEATAMLPGLASLAKVAESPNLYNSASQFLDSFAKLNVTLLDVSIKVEKANAVKGGPSVPQTPLLTNESSEETSADEEKKNLPGTVEMSTEDFLDMALQRIREGKKNVGEVIGET